MFGFGSKKDWQAEHGELQKQIEELKQNHAQEIEKLNVKIATLETNDDNQIETNDDGNKHTDADEKNDDKGREEKEKNTSKIKSGIAIGNNWQAKLNSKFAQLEKNYATLTENYATLTENHAELEIQNKSLKKDLHKAKEWKGKYGAAQQKIKEIHSYYKQEIQDQKKIENEYKKEQEEELQSYINENGSLNDKLDKKSQECDELQKSWRQKCEELKKNVKSTALLNKKKDAVTNQLNSAQEDIKSLTQQLVEEKASKEEKIRIAKKNKYTFCGILSLLIIIISVLCHYHKTMIQEIETLNNQFTNHNAAKNEVPYIDKRLNGVIKDLKSKLNVKVEDYIILNQKHEILQNDNNELKERNKKSIDELNNDINNKNSKYEQLYDENKKRVEIVKTLETNEIELTKKLNQYKDDKEFCELQNAQQKKLIEKLQT